MKFNLLPIFALFLCSTARAELKVVSTEHRDVASFKRISEYFTGKENTGRYMVFRTEEKARTGFYISLQTESKQMLSSVATVRLSFVPPGTQEVSVVNLPSPEPISRKRLLIGMTGPRWTDTNARPLAWKIELLDGSGRIVDDAQSFLWSEQPS